MSDRDPTRGDHADEPAVAAFCPEGCYWECEHLVARGEVSAERNALRPVEDGNGIRRMRCRDCGDYLYDVVAHAREHARMRQLGWLPEQPPAGAPRLSRATPCGLARRRATLRGGYPRTASHTETCLPLSSVNGRRSQSPRRSRSLIPATVP